MNITAKKRIVVATALVVFATALNAQNRIARYEITSAPENAAAYSAQMEQRFAAYNAVFRFDPASLASPLRVRVFTEKNEYDSYVVSKLGSERAGAVYLHYRDPQKSELVIHKGSDEEKRALPHQAFIQFLRAFVPNPPLWIRDGFAAYFSDLSFDEAAGKLVYKENLAWLGAAKHAALNPEAILLADNAAPVPQASSRALVSFFTADKESGYYRALTDSFMVLAPGAEAVENARAVHKRIVLFNTVEGLTNDYNEYLAGKKTFVELVEEGQKQYRAKNYAAAGSLFHEAAEREHDEYAPWYYLGLIAYAEKKFSEAEAFYKTALNYTQGEETGRNASAAAVQYARGVNAAAQGQKTEASAFLREAAALDGARFQAKCDELLGKLE